MNPTAYLQSLLETATAYQLTDEDQKILQKEGVEGFIYRKLTSKKFRKWKMEEDSQKRVRAALRSNITKNQPIQFTYPFGGYKLWSLDAAPQVDWAEFFSIAYYCQYVAPILQVYKPGVLFSFSSDDIIIERMNNTPKKDTDAYFDSFTMLLKHFSKYFPSNIQMEIVRVADMYSKKEYEEELQEAVIRLKQTYPTTSQERQDMMMRTSRLNIEWQGAKDLTEISEAEKEHIIAMGPIYHDAEVGMSKRAQFVRGEDKIVVFTTVVPNAIAIGTNKNAIVKFWMGVGVLEEDDNSYTTRIFSPKQWEKIKNKNHELVKTTLINLPNFQTILVYKEKIDLNH
ncbi:MAG: hypothetical protein AAB553_03695 [Patescibacteria group bacterium]